MMDTACHALVPSVRRRAVRRRTLGVMMALPLLAMHPACSEGKVTTFRIGETDAGASDATGGDSAVADSMGAVADAGGEAESSSGAWGGWTEPGGTATIDAGIVPRDGGTAGISLGGGGARFEAGVSSGGGGSSAVGGSLGAGGVGSAAGGGASGTGGSPGSGGSLSAGGGSLGGGGSSSGGAGGLPGTGGFAALGGSSPADGGVQLEGKPCAGYTLVSMPELTSSKFTAKLVDMAGNVVHDWGISGFPAKMLPGGSLLGCSGVVGTYDCVTLCQASWTGDTEWSFSNWTNVGVTKASRQHHDFERQGNPVGYYAPGQEFVDRGSTLVLAHEVTTVSTIRSQALLDDVIYEVSWSATRTSFEWHGAQHIDEFGFDQAALDDIRNRTSSTPALEWLHGNSLSRVGPNRWFDEGHAAFHPDNLIYSSRDANFVVILDARDGHVVWRIGPDFAGRPEEKLGQFAGQHNPHMIPKGLPGAGNILVFDNGGASGYGGTSTSGPPNRYSRAYSRVLEFHPITFDIVWQYGSEAGDERFYSQLISNAQRLPNGNTLITIGGDGHVIEVTPNRAIVWEYRRTGATAAGGNSIYRSYRIPPEWLPAGENEKYGGYETWASLFEP